MKSSRVAMAVAYVALVVTAVRTQRAPDAAAGRQLYVSGSEAVNATVAAGELPSTLLPCVNCHGAGGSGVAEGGVVPSNIRWLELTKPYRAETPNGRRRPAYNEQTLRRAIIEGIDAGGNPLHPAMPRYAMSPEQLNDLAAYLKVLGSDEVPGVTADSIRVGTVVPAARAEMAKVLSAYFDEAGAIHGRRITVDAMTALDEADPPFALVGGLTDARVEAAAERAGVPVVLPVSIHGDASASNRQRFYLSSGIEAQIRALLEATKPPQLKIVASNEELLAVARRVAAELQVAEGDAGAVLVLDRGASDIKGSGPFLFIGNLLPPDFLEYGDRVRVALTVTPGDLTPQGVAEYRAFALRHGISGAHFSAYAAAQAFVYALKQSGRELTRDALRQALESLYEFETGVTPPLTFGRGRRIAAPRIHIATVDARGALTPIENPHVQKTH